MGTPESPGAKDKGKKGAGKGGAGKSKDKGFKGGGGADASDDGDFPNLLRITVPNGIPDQKRCTGQYELVKGHMPNNKPLWKHTKTDRWLYNGTDDLWYVGDMDEYSADFNVCEGYIRSPENSKGRMPYEVATGRWERFNTKTDTWGTDGGVVVATQG